MLTKDDLSSLRGVTIVDAEIHERAGGQVLRLHLRSGNILAISTTKDGLDMVDETSIP